MRRTALWLACLAWLLCATPTPADEPERARSYPTFEVFTSSRMFRVGAGDLERVDLAALAEQIGSLDETNRAAARFARQLFPAEHPDADGPSAELLPKPPPGSRGAGPLVPLVMMKLEPLWRTPRWSDEQVALARHGLAILERSGGLPSVAFAPGADAANHAALGQLVRWFHAETRRPERLAAMIFTLDDGPFVGLPHAAQSPLPALESLPVGDQLELRLARVERVGESFAMQCLRDGQPLWTRIVSGRPAGTVERVDFVDEVAPESLGTYGWHVYFRVAWTYGREQAHLYLDPSGELLFYFLSW